MNAKIEIPESGWDMTDWEPAEIVVEGIVMALEGCGGNEDRVAVVSAGKGRELRVVGVRRTGNRVELVVEEPAR